jgi:hypothetical protein
VDWRLTHSIHWIIVECTQTPPQQHVLSQTCHVFPVAGTERICDPGTLGRMPEPRIRSVRRFLILERLAMSVSAVERFELAHVVAISRAKGVVVDGPARGVIGVSVTVLLDETVEEFEKVPGCSQIPQCIA